MRFSAFILFAFLTPLSVLCQGPSGDTTICQGQSVTLYGQPSGGGGSYSWSPGGATSSSISVSPNNSTVYSVTFTPVSGPSTVDKITVTVNQLPVITLPVTVVCNGDTATITAEVNIAGGKFKWTPGGDTTQTVKIVPTINKNTYGVTYTVNGCSGFGSVPLTVESSPSVTAQWDTTQCASLVIATASGGSGSYQYDINNGPYQQSNSFSNVTAGNYTVRVEDSHGCSALSSPVTVGQTSTLSFTVDTVSVICNGGNNGSITVQATGGSTPYQYSLNNGTAQSSATFNNLAAGNYTINVQDAHNCSASSSIVLYQPVAISLTFDTVNVTCGGASTGAIITTATNGKPPYQFALNSGAYQMSDTFSNLAPATYTINAKDVNGCTAAGTVPVAQTFELAFTLDTFNTACAGVATGTIVVNVTEGVSPFQYSLDSNTFQSPDSFTNLAAGTYSVQIKDGNGCTVLSTGIGIHQATQVSLTASADSALCFNSSNGLVVAASSGGTMPYQYSLDAGPWQTNDTFANLSAGIYTVSVQDVNNCSASSSTQVYQPAQMVLLPGQVTGVLCPGQQNGTLTDSATGGTPPYSYSATSDGANFRYSSGTLITGLDTGTYTVYAADANTCIATGTIYIPNAQVDSFSTISDSTSCFGPQYTDGGIQVLPLSNTNVPYQYSLDSETYQYSPDFTNLSKGVYNITVMNTNGCLTQIPPVTVYEATEGIVTVSPATDTLPLGQSVQLTSTFGPFPQDSIVSYFWNPEVGINCVYCPNPIVTPYIEQNTYTLTLTYNSHCTASADVTILVQNQQMVFVPNSFTPNGDGNNDVFYIYGSAIKTSTLQVFNRWGEQVFESTNQMFGWDGTYKGAQQQQGVYSYRVEVTFLDNTHVSKTGSITLLR